MRRRNGFTLIELMIVLGIISILASLPIVYMPRWQINARVARAQRVLESTIREARVLAVANRSFVRVRVAAGSPATVTLSEGKCPIGDSMTAPWSMTPACNVAAGGCNNALTDCARTIRTPIRTSGASDFARVTITPAATVTFTPWGTYLEGVRKYFVIGSALPKTDERMVAVDVMGTVVTR